MSDYLLNLAARILRPAAAIQPRRASRFEPPAVAGRSESVSIPADWGVEHGEASRAEQRPEAPPPEAPRTVQTPTETMLRTAASRSDFVTESSLSPLHAMENQAERTLSVERPDSEKRPVSPRPVSASQTSNPADREELSRDRRNKLAPLGTSTEVTKEAAPANPALSPLVSIEDEQSHADAARIERGSQSEMASEQPRLHVDHGHRIPAPMRAAMESAPAIKVTIGRIDVRAIMPAAPAARPAPARPGPRLSLEDYLKPRNGGRR